MNIALNIFQASLDVPFKLDRIQASDSWVVGLSLFIAFFLIAVAQRMEPVILKATGLTLFNASRREELEASDIQINSFGYLLLTISFIFSFGICVFEWLDNSPAMAIGGEFDHLIGPQTWKLLFIGMGVALFILIYPFIGLTIGSWLTGERSFFAEAKQQTWISMQFLALFTFVIALIWVLNPMFSEVFQQWIPWAVGFLFFLRFVKCFAVALANGAAWYYIILYFCTLEILPILFLLRCLFRMDCNCLI